MTRFQNCGSAFSVNTSLLAVTTTPEQRIAWSREHARCFICGIPVTYSEELVAGQLLAGWSCPIHGKEDIEIDWTWIDSLFGIFHTDLWAWTCSDAPQAP